MRAFGAIPMRAYSTVKAAPLVAKHPLPAGQAQRVVALSPAQRQEAVKLIAQDPIAWTPAKIAEKLNVSAALIRAAVPGPTRWQVKYHQRMNKLRAPFTEQRPMTDNQKRIDAWIREQQANTLKYREMRKSWRLGASHDLVHNLDLRWLHQLEHRLGKLQEQSLKKLADSRRKRTQG